jgi:hypothetical protein
MNSIAGESCVRMDGVVETLDEVDAMEDPEEEAARLLYGYGASMPGLGNGGVPGMPDEREGSIGVVGDGVGS